MSDFESNELDQPDTISLRVLSGLMGQTLQVIVIGPYQVTFTFLNGSLSVESAFSIRIGGAADGLQYDPQTGYGVLSLRALYDSKVSNVVLTKDCLCVGFGDSEIRVARECGSGENGNCWVETDFVTF